MIINLFDPALTPKPDEFGMFWHPHLTALFPGEMTDWDEASDSAIALGFNVEAEEMDSEFGEIRAWNPKREGWMLAGIGDSDDGPTAYFVKPIVPDSAPPLPMTDGVWGAITEALGCFEAAYTEGLHDKMMEQPEGEPGSLRGLLERRILHAIEPLRAALSLRTAPPAKTPDFQMHYCEKCMGAGEVAGTSHMIECPLCDGTGFKAAPPLPESPDEAKAIIKSLIACKDLETERPAVASLLVTYAELDRAEKFVAGLPESPWKGMESCEKTSKARLVYCAERENTYTVTWDSFDGEWRHFGGSGNLTETPTAWMPLPAAPDSQKGGEG